LAEKRQYKLKQSFTYEGKRYWVRANNKQELAEKLVKKREEVKNNWQKIVNPTLNHYYEEFTNVRRRELRESTLRAQKCQYNMIACIELKKGIFFGDLKVKDITRREIEQAREILLNQGKTAEHLNISFKHLNHVFASAVIDDLIIKNPCKALKPLKRQAPLVSSGKHRALSEEETRRFFEAAELRNSFYYNAFLCLIKSGLRIGELAALNSSDIDYKHGFIHIKRTVMRDETGNYCMGEEAKTQSGVRDIPLTDDLSEIIKNQEGINRVLFGYEFKGLLFKSSEGEILREYTLNREIKRICDMAGIDLFTSHAFRNTFATRFMEQRPQDFKILSEILGHKDVSITLNLYTHVMVDKKVEAMENISIKTS